MCGLPSPPVPSKYVMYLTCNCYELNRLTFIKEPGKPLKYKCSGLEIFKGSKTVEKQFFFFKLNVGTFIFVFIYW